MALHVFHGILSACIDFLPIPSDVFQKMTETQGPFHLINSCLICAKRQTLFSVLILIKIGLYMMTLNMFVDTCTDTGRNTYVTILVIHICKHVVAKVGFGSEF